MIKLYSKNKICFYGFIVISCVVLSSSLILSQEITASNDNKSEQLKPDREYPLNQYWPMLQTDPRFAITGMNVDRRFAKNGSGEFLDVLFILKNKTSDPLNLIGFVMAFWESDGIDHDSRKLIPYPKWRQRDYDKELNIIHYMRVSPNQISPKEVWDYSDSDFFHQNTIMAKRRNSIIGPSRPVSDTLPPFWKYIEFAKFHSEKGLEFVLYGDVGPAENKHEDTNYKDPTQAELKTKIFKNIDAHTYSLEFSRRQTIFRSYHYSKFRADYKFFNRVSIIIMDADKAKIFNEQKARELKAGEELVEPIVAQQVLRIHKPLKNN